MMLEYLIIGALILIAGILDWKFKLVPSILLTAMIFFVAFLNPANLWFGVMGFIMAYLLFEAGFFGGVGDIKVMTMISFLISTTQNMFMFIMLVLILGFIWKALLYWRYSTKKNFKIPTEVPFIPVFFFVYLTLYFLEVFA